MITERIMPIAMFLFLITIGINGFIVVSGQLPIGEGHTLSEYIGDGTNQLGSDLNGLASSIDYAPSQPDDATVNADAGFSLFTMAGNIWNGVTSTVSGAVSNLIGIQNLNLLENMLVGIEKYMDLYIAWFPNFAAIFLSIKYLALGVKVLVIGYAGSVLVRTIVGRRL